MKRFQNDAGMRLCFTAIVLIGTFAVLLAHLFWPSISLAATSAFDAVVSYLGPDGKMKLAIFLVSMTVFAIELVYMTSPDYLDRKYKEEMEAYRAKPDRPNQ